MSPGWSPSLLVLNPLKSWLFIRNVLSPRRLSLFLLGCLGSRVCSPFARQGPSSSCFGHRTRGPCVAHVRYNHQHRANVSLYTIRLGGQWLTSHSVNGTMIETCVYTFTPVGQQVQEVTNCTTGPALITTTLVAVRLPSSDCETCVHAFIQASSTASPTAAAAFVLPGTSIQVLPIGLGIYGGITALAIAAVAFVTWERIQYRKVCMFVDAGPQVLIRSCRLSASKGWLRTTRLGTAG